MQQNQMVRGGGGSSLDRKLGKVGLDETTTSGPPLLHPDSQTMFHVECNKGEPLKTKVETITETKRETFLNRAILDKDISEQGVKGIGPVREEMDSNMEDEKKKKKIEVEEALTGPRSRTHVGLKEEKKVWKQELLNKWMAPKEEKEIDRESMIQNDNWKDTYHHKKRNRKKKACIDSNQRKVTNWFCKVQKAENEQERLE